MVSRQVNGLFACFLYLAASMANATEEFLTANAVQEGVVTTASGLQYKVVKAGTGVSPKATDMVKVHYHGTLIDGTVFDSSVQRGVPTSFALNQVIKGWTEGLQTMKSGGKTIFYIPADIAYGDRSVGSIPPGSTLIFEVELLSVFSMQQPASLDEVRAFSVTNMDCGNPPTLPADKAQLGSVQKSAESYTACARDYYKYASLQLEGLIGLMDGADTEMRDAVLDKLRDSKKVMASQLDPAVAFVKNYEALKAM